MSNWYFAANGQQQGPYPEAQFRDLIANGSVRADTLVWTEGMAGWQKAAEVPGLMASAGAPPVPHGGPPMMAAAAGTGNPLAADLTVWDLLWRTIVYIIGMTLVIPAPWVAPWFYRWFASRVQVPGRPNFAFTGQPGDIWWVFVLLGLSNYVSIYDSRFQLLVFILQAVLGWFVVRWIASNVASNGQRLPTAFNGSIWAFIGWQLLLVISFISIIGWAWVVTAMVRWMCRNVSGTRREILFNASGWQVLWRSVVLALLCALIIPIPWMIRWYGNWYVSQFALAPRGTLTNA